MPTDEQASAEYDNWERPELVERIKQLEVFCEGWRKRERRAARKALEDAALNFPFAHDAAIRWLRARAAEMYPNDHEPKETD